MIRAEKKQFTSTMTSRTKPSKKENPGVSEDFEVLDVRDIGKEAESLLQSVRKYLSEGSHSKQLAIGGVSGWYKLSSI